MQSKRILYVSSVAPRQGLGGSIVVYRHLKYLQESGWQVSVLTNTRESKYLPSSWQHIILPDRKWWWLPVRAAIPITLKIRLHCWLLESRSLIIQSEPISVLTVLRDYYAPLAALISQKYDIPLSVIIHDDWKARSTSKKHKLLIENLEKVVLNQASRIWPVSDQIHEKIDLENISKSRKLLPVPSGEIKEFVTWSNKFSEQPVIGYAGNVYPSFFPVIETVAKALKGPNGKLVLISKLGASIKECFSYESQRIFAYPLFQNNIDAARFLAKECSCILVAHPFGDNSDLMKSSFPSKLLEFSALGLPIMILAPKGTELSNWAIQNHWICYSENLLTENVAHLINKLSNQKEWLDMANQSRKVSKNEFNPNTIHRQFLSDLPRCYSDEG